MNIRLVLPAFFILAVVLAALVGPYPGAVGVGTEGVAEAAEPCFPEGWTVLGSGTWSCDGSTILGHNSSGSNSMLVSSDTFSDFELSADVSTVNREASLAFRVQDQFNAYILIFEPDGIPPFPGGIWVAREVAGSQTYPFYSHPEPFPTAGEVAHLRIIGQGSTFEIEFNGVSLGTIEDSTFSSGKLGLRTYGDAGLPDDARYSNVIATDTTPPPDSDGDGVPDAADECPGTPAGATVDAFGCTVVTETTQEPPAGVVIVQEYDVNAILGLGFLRSWKNREVPAGDDMRWLQNQLLRLGIEPVEHTLCVESTGNVEWDAVRIYLNGVDKTEFAAVVPASAPPSPLRSKGCVYLRHYWHEETVTVRAVTPTDDGGNPEGEWTFSVETELLRGTFKGDIRGLLGPIGQLLEFLELADPVY